VARLERNPDDELVIEVDGEDVHLGTLDAKGMLAFASSFLELLEAIADDRGESIAFTGLRAFEKCGSLGTYPSDAELARQVALDAHKMLASRERPRGLIQKLDRVRQARAALPAHYRTLVKVRGFERPISAEPVSTIDELPYSMISIRAYVARVGGSRPRASFKSKSERRPFSLELSEEQAVRLGAFLYKTVDIDALVARDYDGNIEEGRLREFHPLTDDPGAWISWFRESGIQSWDDLKKDEDGGRDDGPQ